jgi:hypothetical protein
MGNGVIRNGKTEASASIPRRRLQGISFMNLQEGMAGRDGRGAAFMSSPLAESAKRKDWHRACVFDGGAADWCFVGGRS